jgi:serine/threonine protein kinase
VSSSSTPNLVPAVDPDLEPGHIVGEYRIDGKLGQGAFGTVYRAVHPLIDKLVAIKVLARRYSVDPEMVSRFIAEARAVNQIRNRNIIDIFSFGGLEDGRQYYVMEYLDGEPFDATLDRIGKLPLAQALPILRGVAKALDAAHAKGIAHRDLKAENVFLATDPDGGVWPKLLDFGIAKLLAPDDGLKHKTRTGMPVGTPYYMSPEQCRGKDVDHRTDYYAFGILAYRALAGTFPFDADNPMSILMQQVNVDAEPPSTHAPELPAAIDDVVLWLMAKDPNDRPPDLRTAMRAFEEAAQSVGVDIRPTQSWDLQSGPHGGLQTQPPVAVPRRSVSIAPATKSRLPILVGVLAVAAVALGVLVAKKRMAAPAQQPAAVAVSQPPAVDAAAADAPAAEAPTPTPAEPTTVIVTITGAPEGTEVLVGTEVIGAAPGPVQLPKSERPVALTFRADGYLPLARPLVPDVDKTFEVSLKKKPRRSATSKSTRDDIIDVFGGKP